MIPYYKDMAYEDAVYAGMFEDRYTYEEHQYLAEYDFADTELIDKLKDYDGISIMLGAFAPCHEGHIEASLLLNKDVPNLLNVYFPSHDEYVLSKGSKMRFKERIEAIYRVAYLLGLNSVYVNIEHLIAFKHELNFPYILNSFRKSHLMDGKSIYFIMGDDNAGFSLCLENVDITPVIVERDKGYKIKELFVRLPVDSTVKPIVYTNSRFKELSSKRIRDARA